MFLWGGTFIGNKKEKFLQFHINEVHGNMLSSIEGMNRLYPGDYIVSENNNYKLTYRNDGNLVMTDMINDSVVWETKVFSQIPMEAVLGPEGEFMLRDKRGKSYWWARPLMISYNKPFRLVMQKDKNLVLYDSKSKALWQSGTSNGYKSEDCTSKSC